MTRSGKSTTSAGIVIVVLEYINIISCDQVWENQPCQYTKIATFFEFAVHFIYITHTQIHGESYEVYRMKISFRTGDIIEYLN